MSIGVEPLVMCIFSLISSVFSGKHQGPAERIIVVHRIVKLGDIQ